MLDAAGQLPMVSKRVRCAAPGHGFSGVGVPLKGEGGIFLRPPGMVVFDGITKPGDCSSPGLLGEYAMCLVVTIVR